ncbi:MAG: hypothetical protein JNL50_05750 [Phycisphaerae bacterium]|nr:hypothetical protein [Phycisphaerae bacterium]
MPLSPHDMFDRLGAPLTSTVRWGGPCGHAGPGVYAVSISPDPLCGAGPAAAPVCSSAIDAWIAGVPSMLLDGVTPSLAALHAFLASQWVANEAILYVGKASSLAARTAQFFGHALGRRRPHAGGHWIKTLSIMPDLFLHCAECPSPADAARLETGALDLFMSCVPSAVRATLANPELPLPFANRVHPVLGRKQDRLRHDVLP